MDLSKDILTAKEARAVADNSQKTLNNILGEIKELALQNKTCLDMYPLYSISDVAKKNIIQKLEELGYKIFKSHYTSNSSDDFNEITVEW